MPTALLILLSLVGWGYCQTQTRPNKPAVGPIKGLFDVSGRKMYLECSASVGSRPTVVFEAGMNETSATWSSVVPAVSTFARACVYDRAGLGKSHPAGAARTSEQMVSDLEALLKRAGIPPPYLMVGHSFGGLNARLFAVRNPEAVVGMVLIDSVHEDETDEWLKIIPSQIRREIEAGGAMMLRGGEDIDLKESERQVRSAKLSTSKPLIVLARGRASYTPDNYPPKLREFAPQGEALRVRMQKDLSARSTNGKLIFAEKSGHFIHVDEPRLVVSGLREIVENFNP